MDVGSECCVNNVVLAVNFISTQPTGSNLWLLIIKCAKAEGSC